MRLRRTEKFRKLDLNRSQSPRMEGPFPLINSKSLGLLQFPHRIEKDGTTISIQRHCKNGKRKRFLLKKLRWICRLQETYFKETYFKEVLKETRNENS